MTINKLLDNFVTLNEESHLQEKSVSRLFSHMEDHDTGLITAFRGEFSKRENQARNLSLREKLKNLRYDFITVKGSFVENFGSDDPNAPQKEVSEISYFVVDSTDSGNLQRDLIKLGVEFDQDSVLIVPRGSYDSSGNKIGDKAYYVVTTERGGQSIGEKDFSFSGISVGQNNQYMTKLGNRPYTLTEAGDFEYLPQNIAGRHSVSLRASKHWQWFLKPELSSWKESYDFGKIRLWIRNSSSLKEALNGTAFWARVGPDGIEVYEVSGDTHIKTIFDNPELFGTTTEEIKQKYEKYGEPVNFEGKAREEIIKDVAQRGWIRVRHYTGRNDYWSIQTDDTNIRAKALKAFVRWATKIPEDGSKPTMSYDDTVIIMGYNDPNDIKRYDFMTGGVKRYLVEKKA